MQLYALENDTLIVCQKAKKGKDYFCPECSAIVRLKRGKRRQSHFFHLKSNSACHLAQKGEPHLRLQEFLEKLLHHEGAELEKQFPSIGRIADVACSNTKKIFEIQCSPISLEEAQNRSQDYQSLGYQVIWILHDKKYNRRSVSLAEQYLRATTTTYFSNMDGAGRGKIYDQFELIANHRRRKKSLPLIVNLQKFLSIPKESHHWTLFHEGDSLDIKRKGIAPEWGQKKKLSFPLFRIIKNFYLICFDRLLRKASK